MSCSHARSVAFLFLASVGSLARGQGTCHSWAPGFEYVPPGVRSIEASGELGTTAAYALAIFDEGSGPELIVGGGFNRAGASFVENVALWDGAAWSALGALPSIAPVAFAVHDDGSGPALYTVSHYANDNQVAWRWDGTSWTSITGNLPGHPHAVTEFDDGSGPRLYVADFINTGTQILGGVYVWDGTSWTRVGADFLGIVYAVAVHDDGTGSALYAAGGFSSNGGQPMNNVAKWDGSAWTPVGTAGASNGYIESMATYDEGSGPDLFVGGVFTSLGGVPAMNVARWDGSTWSALGAGVTGTVEVLATIDAGAGPRLHVGGNLTGAGGLPSGDVVAWDGATWSSLGSAGAQVNGGFFPSVLALAPDPSGTGLYAAGRFLYVGDLEMNCVAHWDGSAWSPTGPPPGDGMNDFVHALASVDLGTGPTLCAGGDFTTASGMHAEHFDRWDGSSWQRIPLASNSYSTPVHALAVFDDGGGPDLYLGGAQLQRWSGSTVSSNLGPLFDNFGDVLALASFDDGSGARLYAGGSFNTPTYHAIASFDGATWDDVGGGTQGAVMALAAFDGGGGDLLYVGGAFPTPGNNLVRWNGTAWLPLASTPDGPVRALCEFDDGNGEALYVGGNFTHVGGLAANRIAKWDGTSWTALGTGMDGIVHAMTVFDDGSGPALFAGGGFTMAGGIGALFLAKWDGSAWSPVGNGTSGTVLALAGHGPDLYVGGGFTSASGIPSGHVAKWRPCPSPGTRICFGDGSLATPCPCNNFGETSHGCQNSSSTGGATLDSAGTTNPDTVVLFAADERPTALTIFLQGTENHTQGFVYGDGLRCASGTLKRLYTKTASGGAVSAPTMGEPSITARSAALGNPITPGARRYYQTYYRDGNPAFCPMPAGSTFNSSNAVKIFW